MAKIYGTIELKDGRWALTADPHVLIRVKQVFGRVSKGEFGTVHLMNSPETCRDLEWFCQRYPLEVISKDVASQDYIGIHTESFHIDSFRKI